MMKVLLAGGAGFIGSHLADALLKEGHLYRNEKKYRTSL